MLDRRVAPVFNRNFTFSLINPEYEKLANGIEIYFVSGGDQNVVKVDLIFPAGRWYEQTWGTSYFTTQLSSKGTQSKNSFEIASLFDQFGAHLDLSPGMDFVTLSLYSLTRTLPEALNLLSEIVHQPVFPEKEIQQIKSIYIQNLKVNQEKTNFLASKLFRKTLYGEMHPYGKELEKEDVEKINRRDLTLFHQEFFQQFTVVVAGKIDHSSKKNIINTFSPLKTRQPQQKEHILEALPLHRRHAEKENSLQTSLRIGKRTINRSHADYANLIFLNHILGGYFGSRLMKNIREEKGLTYGIYSSVHAMQHDSYLVIGTDVNKENKDLAFDEIEKEIQRLCNEPIESEELETARSHFIGSFQTELSTAFAHAEKIKGVVLYNLEKDHYNQILGKVRDVTTAELQHVASKYFEPESFYEISAG
jgi:predicted Zn-dependent peptidase